MYARWQGAYQLPKKSGLSILLASHLHIKYLLNIYYLPWAVLGAGDISVNKDCYPFGTSIPGKSSSEIHNMLMSKKITQNRIKQESRTGIVGGVGGKWLERVKLRRCHCVNTWGKWAMKLFGGKAFEVDGTTNTKVQRWEDTWCAEEDNLAQTEREKEEY